MRYLGLDLGTRTLGVSVSDATLTIASTVTTIRFPESEYRVLLEPLRNLIQEYQIGKIVLGLPKNMNNSLGEAVRRTLNFKELLESRVSMPINLIDERLSTVEAENVLLAQDISRGARKKVIDSIAASIILDTYLRKREQEHE